MAVRTGSFGGTNWSAESLTSADMNDTFGYVAESLSQPAIVTVSAHTGKMEAGSLTLLDYTETIPIPTGYELQISAVSGGTNYLGTWREETTGSLSFQAGSSQTPPFFIDGSSAPTLPKTATDSVACRTSIGASSPNKDFYWFQSSSSCHFTGKWVKL